MPSNGERNPPGLTPLHRDREHRQRRVQATLSLALIASSLFLQRAASAQDAFIDTTWHQLLMAPRVTGNFRAIAIDRTNAKNIYIGTEEGTLVHSIDGGITWDEIELTPFLTSSPMVNLGLTGDTFNALNVFA